MKRLYNYLLCPFCRAARFYLTEKGINFESINKNPWEKNEKFNNDKISLDMPILTENDVDKSAISGINAIVEYIEDLSHINRLNGSTTSEKNEIRRISEKFNAMFFADVSRKIIYEKVLKRYYGNRSPDSSLIRDSISSIGQYTDYISWLSDRRNWLAGDDFSVADITAAAHISCIDYLGVINWNSFTKTKEWYMRVKSRPSFRCILQDRVPGVQPFEAYSNLDF